MTGIEGLREPSLDVGRLSQFIFEQLPDIGEPCEIQPIVGGQSNPTFFVKVGPRRLVLRMQPKGELLPGAHAIDREFRIMSALAGTNVPVPPMVSYCDDRSIVGTPFYLMEYMDGQVCEPKMAGAPRSSRKDMYLAAVRTLVHLHAIDWRGLGLHDFGKPCNYFTRQVHRWTRQWEASDNRPEPTLERLSQWLLDNIPSDERTVICHGDYRIGNLMFHTSEPRVVAVLDWELSTLGHPLADLAHFCIAFHTTSTEFGGVKDLDLANLGLPSQTEIIQCYSQASGRLEQLQPFHVAFALFRFAAIFDGIQARAARGTAVAHDAGVVGNLRDVFAHRACSLIGI